MIGLPMSPASTATRHSFCHQHTLARLCQSPDSQSIMSRTPHTLALSCCSSLHAYKFENTLSSKLLAQVPKPLSPCRPTLEIARFSGAVDPPLRRTLGRCFRALGASLDRRHLETPACVVRGGSVNFCRVKERLAPTSALVFRSERFRNSPAPLHSSQALTGPSVRLELCDRASAMKHLVDCRA